jgi:hypothetical protein
MIDNETKPSVAAPCELLRACACFNPNQRTNARIRELARHVDWNEFLEAAQHHGLIPLAYRNLSQLEPGIVPRNVLGGLAHAYVVNAGHNLRLTGELLRILDLFEGAGIQTVPFKGPVLADMLFGNISFRQFCDLDILVEQKDARRAKQLLLQDGYQPEFALDGKAETEYIRSEHAFQFQKPDRGFIIELHWRFGSRNQVFPVDPSEVWKRLGTQLFQGREVRVLSREDLLLYLCVHGAKHGWDRLEWIVCISELVRCSPEMKWDVLVEDAAQSGAIRAFNLALLLADDIAPLNLPPAVSASLRADTGARALADQVNRRLFFEEPDHAKREIYRHTFYLRSRERWSDKARILLYFSARVPHPLAKDWRLFRVPASLSFLYYLLRPMRLMHEYGFRRLRAMLRPDTSF